jgi:hypothetical protein
LSHVAFNHNGWDYAREKGDYFHGGLVIDALSLWCPLVFYSHLGVHLCQALSSVCAIRITNFNASNTKFRNAVTFHFTISHTHIDLDVAHVTQVLFIGWQFRCLFLFLRAILLVGGKCCPLLGGRPLELLLKSFVLSVLLLLPFIKHLKWPSLTILVTCDLLSTKTFVQRSNLLGLQRFPQH